MRTVARAIDRGLRALARLLVKLFPHLRRPAAARALVAIVNRRAGVRRAA